MGKYNYGWEANDYMTPPELYKKALKQFGIKVFDLDTCCSIENIPAKKYYKNGQIDGASAEWLQYNWCNPPFNECKKWIEKAYKEQQNGNTTAMLLPVRTETAYWHNYILNNDNVSIEWLRKGYRFRNQNNEDMGIFKNALALVYFTACK